MSDMPTTAPATPVAAWRRVVAGGAMCLAAAGLAYNGFGMFRAIFNMAAEDFGFRPRTVSTSILPPHYGDLFLSGAGAAGSTIGGVFIAGLVLPRRRRDGQAPQA